METLTLSIESDLAQTIKSYAMRQGCTLSGLVESYFFSLAKNEEINEMTLDTQLTGTPLASTLLGALKAPDRIDYKEEFSNSLIEKYL